MIQRFLEERMEKLEQEGKELPVTLGKDAKELEKLNTTMSGPVADDMKKASKLQKLQKRVDAGFTVWCCMGWY